MKIIDRDILTTYPIPKNATFTVSGTDVVYSADDMSQMITLLFNGTLTQGETTIIIMTLAHTQGKPIPDILKVYHDLCPAASDMKFFTLLAWQECCMWNDIECEGVESIEM